MPEYLKIIIVPTADGQRHTITVPEPVDYARTEAYARKVGEGVRQDAWRYAESVRTSLSSSMSYQSRWLSTVDNTVRDQARTIAAHADAIAAMTTRIDDVERAETLTGRLDAIELSVWRYHERPALVERLIAMGYDRTEAAEIVDAYGTGAAEKVALAERLVDLRYSLTEIRECIEDVPDLTEADIDYAKEILDAWDPATTSLNKAFQGDSRLVVFPKIDTSNVTDTAYMFDKCGSLGYVPWFDTSKVTSANFMFGWYDPHGHVKRLPDFKWNSLLRCYGPYTGLPELRHVPSPLDLSSMVFISRLFAGGGTAMPRPFPEIILNQEKSLTIRLLCEVDDGQNLPMTEFPDNVVDLQELYGYSGDTPFGDMSHITIKARGCRNASGMFMRDMHITHAPQIDMPVVENMTNFLECVQDLVYVPDYSASAPLKMAGMFKPNNHTGKIRRIEGLNFARVTDDELFGGYFGSNWPQYELEYLKVINLGQSSRTAYNDLASPRKWGTGSAENRQSLIDSLLTYSYDRAAAGMETCTIKLYPAVKALLTVEEIAAITAKGFTIV